MIVVLLKLDMLLNVHLYDHFVKSKFLGGLPRLFGHDVTEYLYRRIDDSQKLIDGEIEGVLIGKKFL